MQTQAIVAALAASLATLGWIVTTRRARLLARKQFTITTLVQAAFSAPFQADLAQIRPYTSANNFPSDKIKSSDEDWAAARRVINFYEFLAAGISRGDFEEETIRRVEGHRTLRLCDTFRVAAVQTRVTENNSTIWEHMDWIEDRWRVTELTFGERILEWLQERPIPVAVDANVLSEKNLGKETLLQKLFFRMAFAKRRSSHLRSNLPRARQSLKIRVLFRSSVVLLLMVLAAFIIHISSLLLHPSEYYNSGKPGSDHNFPTVYLGTVMLPE